jgi:hypothetical protein
MSSSDFEITPSIRAVFLCASGTVQFHIVLNNKQVGKSFLYTHEEAAALGASIMKADNWEEFPVKGISTSDLRSFGQRLRDYGVDGC